MILDSIIWNRLVEVHLYKILLQVMNFVIESTINVSLLVRIYIFILTISVSEFPFYFTYSSRFLYHNISGKKKCFGKQYLMNSVVNKINLLVCVTDFTVDTISNHFSPYVLNRLKFFKGYFYFCAKCPAVNVQIL